MEDAHTYVFDFAGVSGQGFFAVFDGHAGKEAADWCSKNFHEVGSENALLSLSTKHDHQHLLQQIETNPDMHIPDVFNLAFQSVDRHLTKMSNESQGKIHSGTTAVTAFLRIEDADGHQPFSSGLDATPAIVNSHSPLDRPPPASPGSGSGLGADSAKGSSQSRIKKAFKRLSQSVSSGNNNNSPSATPRTQSPTRTTHARSNSVSTGPVQSPPPGPSLKRTLYVANAGDARGVLCRRGRALRLTYDHKGTDKQEAKRIMDSGGFVMSGRVNGVLAVTRSLGDSSMKEFVVGAPYTTETELTDDDEFLILACDGVRVAVVSEEICFV